MNGTPWASSSGPANGRLDSWKEIAAYLGREIRTVQRWEKEEGLPVHRHAHRKLGSVLAFKPEIDTWVKTRQALLEKREHAPFASRRVWFAAVAGLLVVGIVVARWVSRPGEPPARLQVDIALPPQSMLMHGPSLALSPDGGSLVLAASSGLWLRSLSDTSFRLLPETRDAVAPFWSPDGREIGFFAGGKLKKMALPGGPPVDLAIAPAPQGASGAPGA